MELPEYITSGDTIIFGHWFNQPLGNALNNCTSLTHISFGWKFNQSLGNALNNCLALTHIIFGDNFNQPLCNSLDNCTVLTHIKFGNNFNQLLANSLDNCTTLTHIKFGLSFNQKIDLPHSIRFLSLNCNNRNLIDHLPETIEELEFKKYFNLELDNLPSSIKKITFDEENMFIGKLNCLPDGLEILQLSDYYNRKILSIPTHLKKFICPHWYKHMQDFSHIEVVDTYWHKKFILISIFTLISTHNFYHNTNLMYFYY